MFSRGRGAELLASAAGLLVTPSYTFYPSVSRLLLKHELVTVCLTVSSVASESCDHPLGRLPPCSWRPLGVDKNPGRVGGKEHPEIGLIPTGFW
jgi:hypothetical protein